jgi:CubicO group peptidase (beta-lactamase class C family)
MKALTIGVVLLLLCQPCFAETSEEPSNPVEVALTDPAELESFMDGAMTALLEAHHVAGGTISVVKDGELFFAKGYGFADAEHGVPVDPATSMFRIASVSKLFAWTAIMQLWEQGRVDLDADINVYLDFEIPATFPEPITLTHLLTHTAGFEDRAKGLFAKDIEDLAPLGEVLAKNIPARVVPPGEVAAYSNYGAGLAGYIVQRVSGMPFQDYVEEHIYGPLWMVHSTFRQPVQPEIVADLAIGHTWKGGAHEGQDFEYDPAVADGAMSTSAVDMARFMIAHLQLGRYGDQQILEEDTARRMHSRLFSPDPRIPGMAHGFYEVDANGRRGIGHGGDISYFHSDLLLLPEEDVGIFVSFNSDSGSAARSEIVPLFLDRYFPAPEAKPVEPPADFAARAGRYTGWYRMNRHPHDTIEKVMLLATGDIRIDATDDNYLSVALMGERSRFVEVEPLLFRAVGGSLLGLVETVAFAENESGQIVRAYPAPILGLDRIAWYDTRRFQLTLLAAGVLAFLIRLFRAVRHRRQAADRTPLTRWSHRLANAVSILGLVFLVGFVLMLPQVMKTYLFPDGIYLLLALPVLAAVLTLGVVVLAVVGWIKADGTLKNRIYTTVFSLLAVGFVWFLNYWNLLGWHY